MSLCSERHPTGCPKCGAQPCCLLSAGHIGQHENKGGPCPPLRWDVPDQPNPTPCQHTRRADAAPYVMCPDCGDHLDLAGQPNPTCLVDHGSCVAPDCDCWCHAPIEDVPDQPKPTCPTCDAPALRFKGGWVLPCYCDVPDQPNPDEDNR